MQDEQQGKLFESFAFSGIEQQESALFLAGTAVVCSVQA
jgi:hypothetical protein